MTRLSALLSVACLVLWIVDGSPLFLASALCGVAGGPVGAGGGGEGR